jgi:hypothetical protein
MGKLYKKGEEINPDNKGIKNYFAHGSGKAGGVLVGKRHSEGGIKALNKSTGQPLEMEGGEVVITRNAVSDNTKREFNGQMLTNREILSKINESGGGVSFAKGGDVPKTIYTSGKEYKYGGKTMKDHDIVSSCGCKHEMKKGGSLSKTKAPLKDRVFGSSKNKPGSAASKESAKKITLSDEIVEALQKKVDEYKKQHPSSKLSVTTLKAVMRRGMGAYSTSHRPTITGGAANSRQAWGYARVNKFLKKKAGQQVKAAYVQDDDLLKSGGRIEWHDSDAPDANGKFKSLNAKELAAWLIKTRGKDVQKISASITQQIVFNRKKDPAYASKMERVRKEVYKQLDRKDLMVDGGILDSLNPTGGIFVNYSPEDIDKLQLGENITTYDITAKLSPNDKIIVYRGAPNSQNEIVSGDFVTTNKQLAKDYAGNGVVLSREVRANEILDDITEPLGEEYILRLKKYADGGEMSLLKVGQILHLRRLPMFKRSGDLGKQREVNKKVVEIITKESWIDEDEANQNNKHKTSYFFKADDNKKYSATFWGNDLISVSNDKVRYEAINDKLSNGGTIESFKKVKETHIGTNQSFEGVEYKYKEATIYYNNVDKVWVLTMQKNGKPQKTIGGYKTLKSAQEVGLYYLNNPNLYADGGQMDQDITCVNCGWHWNTKDSDPSDKYVCHKCGFDNRTYYDSDPISKMEKQIALPDTYATYDNLKPILERQGYQINKIMASGGNIHGGKILFTINDDKIDDLLYRSNFDSYVFLDDDGYLLSEKDFERFKVIVSDKGYDENKIDVQDWNYTDYKVGGKLINSPDFLKGKKEELEEHRDVFEKLRKNKLTADQAAELVVLEHLKKKPDYYKRYSSGGKIKLQNKNLISYKEFLELDKRVKSPFADENEYYYPMYCSKEKKTMFFKGGNRRNNAITPQLAYKSFLFHKYKVDFKDLSAKEKNALMLGKQLILENQ